MSPANSEAGDLLDLRQPSRHRNGNWLTSIGQAADAASWTLAFAGPLPSNDRYGMARRRECQDLHLTRLLRLRGAARHSEEDRDRHSDTEVADQCTQKTKHISLHGSGKVAQAAQRASCFHCAGVLPVKRLNTVEK